MVSVNVEIFFVARYTWKKDGQIYNFDVSRINVSLTDGSFTILSAQEEDEGHYQCFANNTYGTAFSDVSLLLLASLRLKGMTPIQSVKVPLGGPLSLRCNSPPSVGSTVYHWVKTSDRSDSEITVEYSDRIVLDNSTGIY